MARTLTTCHEPKIISAVRACIKDQLTYTQIGKKLGMSRSQVAGIVDRHVEYKDRPGQSKKNPQKLIQGSLGIIERQLSDKSRITLIAIASLAAEQEASGYSYKPRDRSFGT